MRVATAIVVLWAMVCSGVAFAQETTGSIIGSVTSQDGAPLPGATLQLVDGDKGFERTAISSADGRYKLVALQPARYELTATIPGFQTVKRPIRVELGRTVTNDIQMSLGAVTETIEVTGEAPLVDVTSTTTGLTVNTDDLNARIPVDREATQIALLAPTSVAADSAFDVDSGVGFTPGQNVASIGGASAGENLYMVNGLNITNFRHMIGSTFVPFEFLDEVQVKTGGYEAEFGRSMGGVINMVTKSGTNHFHGGASVYWKPETLQEQEPDAWQRQNEDEFQEGLEANASIGGPIVRDKLFFFAFIRHVNDEKSRIYATDDFEIRNDAPYYGGKVDWNITPNHRVEGTYLVDSTDWQGDLYAWDTIDRVRGDYISTAVKGRGGDNWIFKYTGLLADNLLLGAQYGVNEFDRSEGSNADECPAAIDARESPVPVGCWSSGSIADEGDRRTAYRGDLDWFVGNHSLRGGFDHEMLTSDKDQIHSGGVYYRYLLNNEYPEIPEGADIVRIKEWHSFGSYDTTTTGIYLQDSWAISPTMTLNLGVRWEAYENFNSDGDAFIKVDDQFAPRVGFVWDPSKRGRQKVSASFGQYHIPIASNTNIRLAGLLYELDEFYQVVDQDPITGLPYDSVTGEPTGLGIFLDDQLWSDGSVPDVQTLVTSNLVPMSQLEFILGYEQMIGTNWSLGARFVHRRFDEVIEDFTIDQALYEKYGVCEGGCFQYVLGNPGSSFEGFYDLDGDGVNDPISFTAEELNYPEAKRDYYAVELTASKRFSNNWMLQASYVWSQLYGNYEGYLKSDLGQIDAGLNQDFDFAGLMDNTYGFLPNDRRHNLKVYGTYAWDMGLQVGGFLSWRTGRPMNAIAMHPHDFWAALYGPSSFFEQIAPGPENSLPSPRGSQGTTDDVYFLDAMIRYDWQAAGIDWYVRADVFNVLNRSSTTEVYEFSGTWSYGVDAGFLQPTNYQPPRSVRLGFGVSF